MIKLAIVGATGRMGLELRVHTRENHMFKIEGLLEHSKHPLLGQKIDGVVLTDNATEAFKNADVVIDFSLPEALPKVLEASIKLKKPLVVGTTGLNEKEITSLKDAAKAIPVLYSSNMSIGINVLHELLKLAVKQLHGYDIEIIEKHHRNKKDAPSGTALALANTILSELKMTPSGKTIVCAREGNVGKREDGVIGIQSVRAGDIVGEHEVLLSMNHEVITLKHEALSRGIFATGALRAASFICSKQKGFYSMSEVVTGE